MEIAERVLLSATSIVRAFAVPPKVMVPVN
jgi:hypothetical protein